MRNSPKFSGAKINAIQYLIVARVYNTEPIGLDVIIFDAVYGSLILSSPLYTLDSRDQHEKCNRIIYTSKYALTFLTEMHC